MEPPNGPVDRQNSRPAAPAGLDHPDVLAALSKAGLSPQAVARLKRLQEEQRSSGLTPREFAQRMHERGESLLEFQPVESKTGWGLPVIGGFVGATGLFTIVTIARNHGHGGWATLLTEAGTCAAIYLKVFEDDIVPRRRLIVGTAIGAALALLLLIFA